MKKRILSILLCLCMVLTLFPVTGFAVDETCTVTFDMNGREGSGTSPEPLTVPKGSKIQAPASPSQEEEYEGYSFVYWYVKGSGKRWYFDRDTVQSDLTLLARWVDYPPVTINAKLDGEPYPGLTLEYRSTSAEGLTYTLTETSPGTYHCDGIKPDYYELYVNNKYYADEIINLGTISYSPSFKFYSVTFDANGQEFTEETAPESKLCWTYAGLWYDRSVNKPADPVAKDSNYRFIGWTVGPERDSGAFDFVATSISSTTVIYAQWDRIIDENTFPVTAERATIVGSSYAKRGEDYHATLVPAAGYELPFRMTSHDYEQYYTHIKIGGQILNTANYTLNLDTGELTIPGEYITDRVEIVAVPRQNPYIVHFNANGGTGTQEGEGAKVYTDYEGYDYLYHKNTSGWYKLPSCTLTPPDGKMFSHWSYGLNYTNVINPGDSVMVFVDRTYYAIWKDAPEGTYTVAYNLTGCKFSGNTNASNGSDYTTELTPKDGYAAPITLVSVQVGSSTLDSSEYLTTQNSETGALTLTVPGDKITGNMTITASAPAAHTHCVCGGDTAVGDHSSHTNVTYQPWDGTSAIDYGDDNTAYVCLTNDVTIQESLEIKDGKTLYLCLNGKTFASNGTKKIEVWGNSRFILCDCAGGGTIDGADSCWGGAGIYLHESTMDMYGGKITGGHTGNGGGGAIALDDVNCVFNMYGGEISGNKADRFGGAIFLNGTLQSKKGGTVNLYGGTISNNSAQIGGAIYSQYGGTVNLYGGEISGNTATANGGGAICLNHSGVLNMTGGKMQNNTAKTDGGAVNLYASTFTFSGGKISNNYSAEYGGAVYLSISGKLNMTGGEICNNTAAEEGGAVHVYGENATFNFSGGTITGNEAVDGGAVYLNQELSTLNMTGGEISGNKATRNGGAVYMFRATSTLNLSGGTIKNNTAGSSGGAVYFNTTSDGKIQGILNISGNPVVKDNTVSGKANNIAMKTGKTLSIVAAMTDGASVGITTQSTDYPVVFSNAYDTDYSGYFFADDPSAYVRQDGRYRLELAAGTPHTHSWATEWTTDGTHHWHECTTEGCDVTNDADKNGYAEHTYDQQVATDVYKASDATCTAKATYYKSCICGAKGTETFESGEVNASNHTFGAWIDEVSATCKTTGMKGHKDCTGCNKHFDADGNEITDLTIPVDPANHEGTLGGWVKTDPDKHWKEYSCCGAKFGEAAHAYDQEIATADYKASDATCTAKATYYKSCICGAKGTEIFESGEVNASNHTFGAWIDEVSATCKTTGTKGHKDCSGCNKHFDATGNEITDLTIPVDPANHEGTLGDWVKTDPNEHWKVYSCCHVKAEKGTHVYTDDADTKCNTCGYERTIESAHTHPITDGGADMTWTGVSSLGEITGTGSYYLTGDILMNSNLNITGTVNLCLNGHKIYTMTGTSYGTVKIQTDATLNVCDCSENESGLITTCRGSYAIENSGTLNLYSGSVERSSDDNEAAVKVNTGAVFNMYGGKIGGNAKAIRAYGTVNAFGGTVRAKREAVQAEAGSEVTVSDNAALSVTGTSYSTIAIYGGAVNIRGGKVTNDSSAAVYAPSGESTLNISGGEISTASSARTDTIRLNSDSVEVTVTGGSITNGYTSAAINTEGSRFGWAIDVYKVKSLTISGAPVINRIYLADSYSITVGEGGLTYETPIEIHCAKCPAPVTGANDTDLSSKFTPRSSFYAIINAKDNVVLFTKAATVTYTDGVDNEEIFPDQTYNTYRGQPTPAFNGTPQRPGYTFGGWYTDEDCTTEYDFAALVTGNLTLYAKWTLNTYTVSFDANGGSTVAAQTVAHGEKAVRPADPERNGYTFGGWYTDEDCTDGNEYDFDTPVTENITLYAKWGHTHNWSTEWTTDDTHHWHECTAAGCDVTDNAQKDGYGAHDYDDDADTTCNTCGYTRTVEPPAHTHSWATEWTTDDTYHWHECTADGCNVTENSGKDGYGAHVYDDDADTTCNTCGYIRTAEPPAHTHSWATEWNNDETYHWHNCTAEGCDVTENSGKDGYGAHDYDNDTDTDCNTCGYIRTITPSHTHSWATAWSKNETHHWHECTGEGCDVTNDADKNSYGEHVYDNDADTTCNTCGYERTVTPPAHEHICGDWQSNRLYHWKVCATCGEKVDKARHDYGTDRTCDICGYVKPRTNNSTTPSQPTDTTTKSADTGDMGIALYAGMTILSLTGGAWVINKKRKGK